jgi:hypothetical protein
VEAEYWTSGQFVLNLQACPPMRSAACALFANSGFDSNFHLCTQLETYLLTVFIG